ncbi:MAG: ABC transporter permease [Firmicutes bacterium]|nr:ABC transporter permease [Bacillota bacterium]
MVRSWLEGSRETWRAVGFGLILLILLVVVGRLLIPGFSSVRNLMTILTLAVLLFLPSIGQTFVIISGGGGVDLSVGAIMSLAEVVAAQLIDGHNRAVLPAGVFVLALGGLVGLINAVGIWYLDIPPLVMTLGMAGIADGAALVYTNGVPGGAASSVLQFIGTGSVVGVPVLILVGVAALIVSQLILSRTGYGRMLRLVGTNRSSAQAARIPVGAIIIATYVLSGIISAFAGMILLGYTMTSYLDAGSQYQLTSIAAVVVGGTPLLGGDGGIGSTALGALVITLINSIVVSLHIGSGAQELVDGAILLLVLVVYGVFRSGSFSAQWIRGVWASLRLPKTAKGESP